MVIELIGFIVECKQPQQMKMSFNRRKPRLTNTPGLGYLFSNLLFSRKCNLFARPAVFPTAVPSFVHSFSLPQFFRAKLYCFRSPLQGGQKILRKS